MIFYLESASGLRLLASESIIFAQRERSDQSRLVSILAADDDALDAGVDRLLAGTFDDCVIEETLILCPFTPKESTGSGSDGSEKAKATKTKSADTDSNTNNSGKENGTPTPTAESGETPDGGTPEATAEATPTPDTDPGGSSDAQILIIDDDDEVADDESSEAEFYQSKLADQGLTASIWSIAEKQLPSSEVLNRYKWVIWSAGGYAEGGPNVADLDPLFGFLNEGGHLTISSRNTFFGQGFGEPEPIRDVVLTDVAPDLTRDLPTEPIMLDPDLPPVVAMEANPDENESLFVVMRRGDASGSAGAPVMFILTDEDPEVEDATGARMLVLGIPIAWFPDDVTDQLINNISAWMLADPE